MMRSIINTRFMILSAVLISSFFQVTLEAQTFVPKKAGISIRIDDNQLISRYRDFYNVFAKHNYKFSIAMNLGNADFLNSYYTDSIRNFQSHGIELMDHTPNHRTNYFNTFFNPGDYVGLAGVDHIINNKICLKFLTPDTSLSSQTGYVNVNGNMIRSIVNGEFSGLRLYIDQYIYFPSLSKLVLINTFYNSDSISVFDVWQDSVDLGNHNNIKYFLFDYYSISMTKEAYKILGNESLKLASDYNLLRPVAWIQPGGVFWPQPSAEFVKEPLGDSLNYTTGAMYQNTAYKVFNEYDPNNDRRFGMNWGDFSEEIDDINLLKKKIADGIAKNKVMIGNNHFDVPDWNQFLLKIDELLDWCALKNIPVKTYSEWSNILYDHSPNPATNIFPGIDNDLNEDSIPDGYILFPGFSEIDNNDGPIGVSSKSFRISQVGPLFFIFNLGGVEKGANKFEFWIKGEPGNIIEIKFNLVGSGEQIYTFSPVTSDWEKQTLDNSLNGNTTLVIPNNVSVVDITANCSEYNTGTVKISGMNLIQQDPLPVELNSFTAKLIGDGVILNWTTQTETNNYGFDIEKFFNGKWTKIGFVQGSGNSNSPKNYLFKDDLVINNKSNLKYRIKQIDNDGQFTYSSEVQVILIPDKLVLYQNYPNPFNPFTTIKYELPQDGIVKIKLYNSIGEEIKELVNEFKNAGSYSFYLNAQNMTSGIYFYTIVAANSTQTKKMILLK